MYHLISGDTGPPAISVVANEIIVFAVRHFLPNHGRVRIGADKRGPDYHGFNSALKGQGLFICVWTAPVRAIISLLNPDKLIIDPISREPDCRITGVSAEIEAIGPLALILNKDGQGCLLSVLISFR